MTDNLDTVVFTMLRKLVAAQKKLHDTQPQHLKARTRYLTGLRETLRAVLNKKVKLLLIAPDVEPVHGEDAVTFLEEFEDSPLLVLDAGEQSLGVARDIVAQTLHERALGEASAALGRQLQRRTVKSLGLDGSIRALVTLCRLKGIPFVFCMGRKRFAYAMKVPFAKVSAVAILLSEGANDEYRAVVRMAAGLREQYQLLRPPLEGQEQHAAAAS
jgi:ribosomal protein L7Ae-like RNA K-turn-binding protein